MWVDWAAKAQRRFSVRQTDPSSRLCSVWVTIALTHTKAALEALDGGKDGVPGDDVVEDFPPAVGAVEVAMPQGAAFQHAQLVD